MMRKLLLTLVAVFGICSAYGQAYKDLKINEILVKNADSYADDHAHKVGWIEIYNASYSKVNLSGMHLRLIQGGDTTTYRIPKTDSRTLMSAQGYLIFFADSTSNRGTFHTNFRLDVLDSVKWNSLIGINDRLELLDQGRNVIDAIEYDVNTQMPDVSYGRLKQADGTVSITSLRSITPLQANETHEATPKNELFRMQDPAGIAMSITAMGVVFIALILLYLVFRTVGNVYHKSTTRKEAASQTANPTVKIETDGSLDGETIAAIAMGLRLYDDDMHDLESSVITINRVARAYSPWSSKIYSLQQLPNKK